MSESKDVIVLIPGFLGFEQIGGFYYFADRVGAAMRGVLTGPHRRGGVPVAPVTTLPTDRLKKRQVSLLEALARVVRRFPDAEGLHLVGHSTGGTDALLLLGEQPVARGKSWAELDPPPRVALPPGAPPTLRSMIRTVVTIGSPHHGSCITMGRLARFFRRPLVNFHAAGSVARAAVLLAAAVRMDTMARSLIAGAFWDRNAALRYVVDALSARGLVDDLRPAEMSKLHRRIPLDLSRVCLRTVVTMAAQRTRHYPDAAGKPREPDRLFEYLYRQTGGDDGFCGDEDRPPIEESVELLEVAVECRDLLIRNPLADLRGVTPWLNDGIVSSVRQLYNPGNAQELCAVVAGDHLDVLGYYPYWAGADGRTDGELVHTGILHSGSGFGDQQFFELYARVAGVIAGQLEPPA